MSALYGAVASSRRRWYARDPQRRRRLGGAVVSIGNLRVGGAGKTPVVEHVARMLRDGGLQPAVLTRGYGRRQAPDGVTVVSSPDGVLADISIAGDEPLMLARALPGVPVLVGADRYLSGLLAERRFGATIHVLDDGFQHFQLARDVDVLLADEGDLIDRPLPAGSLREPLACASAADVLLVTSADADAVVRVGRALGVSTVFQVVRSLGLPRGLDGAPLPIRSGARAFAFAGIARPERFFADLGALGWRLVGTMRFRDHLSYEARHVASIVAAATAAGAEVVLTTEKDGVRLAGLAGIGVPLGVVPLTASVEPAADFSAWLFGRIKAVRTT